MCQNEQTFSYEMNEFLGFDVWHGNRVDNTIIYT